MWRSQKPSLQTDFNKTRLYYSYFFSKTSQNSWNGEADVNHQTKLLGHDRHYNRYWLAPGFYIGVLVEKVSTGQHGEIRDGNCETHPSTDRYCVKLATS